MQNASECQLGGSRVFFVQYWIEEKMWKAGLFLPGNKEGLLIDNQQNINAKDEGLSDSFEAVPWFYDRYMYSNYESRVSRDEILVSREGGNLLLSGTVHTFSFPRPCTK